jgi:hypothetical protein
MGITFDLAETIKFDLLASGLRVTPRARDLIDAANHSRALTSADYASTSGLILQLDGDVWVNAPTVEHNANFVADSEYLLDVDGSGLCVRGRAGHVSARMWLQPAWHSGATPSGQPHSRIGVAHGDRVRVSPIEGCAYTCTFCDLPYEFRYRPKDVADLIHVLRLALSDPDQPSAHILISGGTPRPEDYAYVRDCYEAVLTEFPGVPVDIMMVPLREVLDLPTLRSLGLREVSINLEIWSNEVARRIMPRKHKQGRDHYLDYLSEAAEVLGGHNVRSMLMLGLEPLEDTLAGVAEIASRGCVPVLSPFRADPSTPLRGWPVPSAAEIAEAYRRAWEITAAAGVPLGPSCMPCAHNTVTLPARRGHGSATMAYGTPHLVG